MEHTYSASNQTMILIDMSSTNIVIARYTTPNNNPLVVPQVDDEVLVQSKFYKVTRRVISFRDNAQFISIYLKSM